MKKLSKIVLSAAAASIVTAAMAVTAMAADSITGTYDNETGVVTMEGVIGSGASQTLLVLNNDAEDINSASIAYINQIDNSGTFSTFMLAAGLKPAAASESVTYNIKVGGTDGSVQTGTLTIDGDAPATVTIKIGDVDDTKSVTAMDITRIRGYLNGVTNQNMIKNTNQTRTKADGETIVIGDVDGTNTVTAMDITRIQGFLNGITNQNMIKNTNQEVEVIVDKAD